MNFDPQSLSKWATDFIQSMVAITARARKTGETWAPDGLELGQQGISWASGSKEKRRPSFSICGKRLAPANPTKTSKGLILKEVGEPGPGTLQVSNDEEQRIDSQDPQVELNFTPNREQTNSDVRNFRSGRSWSWKKAARNRGRTDDQREQGSTLAQGRTNGRLPDFPKAEEAGSSMPPPPRP